MKFSLVFYVSILLMVSCANAPSGRGSTERRLSNDMPEWALNVPSSPGIYYGVGQAKKQNPSLATQTATARARTQISQAVESKVSTMMICIE